MKSLWIKRGAKWLPPSEMPRLIFINRFYWPEEPATSQLLTDLAEGLVEPGTDVSIITSHSGNVSTPREETHQGVLIHRIGSTRLGKNSLIGRVFDFISFTLGTAIKLLTFPQRDDTVIFLTDPPLLGALLWPLLKLRRISYIHWVQDIYPEIACELTPHQWLKLFRPIRDLSWRQADYCITLGQDMANILSGHGVVQDKIRIIPNWPPRGLGSQVGESQIEQLKQKWGLSGKFVLLYSGNLGRVHDLSPLIEVADQLRATSDIALVFIGHGAQVTDLCAKAKSRGLQNIFFFPPQPRAQLNLTLSLGDIHFVSMREGCEGFVYPSKLYGITAVSRPVIFIGPPNSSLFHTIQDENLGFSFAPKDTREIALTLLRFKASPRLQDYHREAATRFAVEHDFNHAMRSWSKILLPESGLAAE